MGATDWLFNFFVKKQVKRILSYLAAILVANQVPGVDINTETGIVAISVITLIDFARNLLKVKYGLKFI